MNIIMTRDDLYTSSEAVGSMADIIESFLMESGYAQAISASTADKIVLNICDYLGGAIYYFPFRPENKNDKSSASRTFLTEFAMATEGVLCRIPEFSGESGALAADVTERLRFTFQSISMYIPRGDKGRQSARNRAILSEHRKGVSVRELARKYGISLQRIYTLTKPRRN